MNSIFKKILLLWAILFTNLLFADGDDIGISVYDAAAVHEDSGTMSFTIKLSEAPDWCDELTINYTTADGSATAGDDYTSKSGSETFYGSCLFPPHLPQTTKIVAVDITNTPATYEPNEYLYMNI
ncbi:MAG: hypothetical protein KAG56_00450, partial [Sulfurovaceae bacterium]|nr:hypothetical protein [Sulfurovaceae bacterium]